MEVFRSEIKAGLLILVSALLLVIGIFLLSDIRSLWEEKREVVLLFQYADGINKGAPVRYAGLEVGEVTGVRIAQDKGDRIAVTVTIDPQARVRTDSHAYIRNLGMMGAKYVEITPGSPEAPELTDGAVLDGETPTSLSQIVETGQQIAVQLRGTVQEIQALIHEIRGNTPIQETVQNANAFLLELRQRGQDLDALFKNMDDLLQTTHVSLDRLAGSLQQTGEDLHRTTREGGEHLVALLKELRETNRSLQERMARLEAQLTPVLGQARHGLAEAGGLMRDARSVLDANDHNLYMLTLHLKETARHLEALSEDLRAHPWKIIWKGEGTFDEPARTPSGGPMPEQVSHDH